MNASSPKMFLPVLRGTQPHNTRTDDRIYLSAEFVQLKFAFNFNRLPYNKNQQADDALTKQG